ncbi:hypothetical protein GmHk_19G055271 [Glycine max]|nr:hypothetical protein GmHk_19G055271 [Glycine max]
MAITFEPLNRDNGVHQNKLRLFGDSILEDQPHDHHSSSQQQYRFFMDSEFYFQGNVCKFNLLIHYYPHGRALNIIN